MTAPSSTDQRSTERRSTGEGLIEVEVADHEPTVSLGGPTNVSTAAATWALFVGFGLLMMGNGLGGTLVGIRAELAGFNTVVSGVVMSGYFAGFLLGSRLVPKALATVGHIRVFAAMASVASSSVLIHAVTESALTWFVVRSTTGLCMAGLYLVVESWLNDLASNENRGRLLSVYMVLSVGGLAAGQLLVTIGDALAVGLFVVSSVLVSVSLVPITLSATSTPPPIRQARRMSLAELVRIVPTGVAVSFFGGIGAGVLIGMGAVYATSVGLSPERTAIFVSAPLIGGVLLQFPIGLVSDRFSRRGVILVVAASCAVVAFSLSLTSPGGSTSMLLMLALGGLLFPLYSLGLAYSNDWITGDQRLGAASTLITVNGSGALVGPLLAAALMGRFGAAHFFTVLMAVHLVIVVYVGLRILIRDAPPVEDQEHFAAFPTRGTAMVAQLWVRRRRSRP